MTNRPAGYATLDSLIEKLLKVAPARREAKLRRWIAGSKEEKDRTVAKIMAKVKERETH